jgi:serine/threonine protein kinase
MGKGLCWFALVQDYIPGKSFEQLLDEGRRFTQEQVRALATQVLEILTYLHGLNSPILHRDIKPSNLILGEDEQVYLVDFGAVADPTVVEGVTFTVVGTAGYAPLEQFWGRAVPASDLYALGATLIHLLTGTAPADLPQKNLRILFRDKVSLDASFLCWIESLIEPDLTYRFSSATKAIQALRTGHYTNSSAQRICRPAGSRIQLLKSKKCLVIELIHHSRISSFIGVIKALIRIIYIGLPLILLILIIPLIFANAIKLNSASINPIISTSTILFTFYILPGSLAIFLMQIINSRNCNLVLNNFFDKLSYYFSKDCLCFDASKVSIRLDSEYHQKEISSINSVEPVPGEGVIIQVGTQEYVFGSDLTELELNWLVEEIQDWIYTNLKSQG